MPEPGAAAISPRPTSGRVFEAGRRIRLGDVDPDGRCRFDALVRYLQDVARDDSAESGLPAAMGWVVRRTMLEVHQAPSFQEWVSLATWCSGVGGRWAERRTEVHGDDGAYIEAVALWVCVDETTGRPARLVDEFHEIYGEAAGDRRVSARTVLPAEPPPPSHDVPWPVRYADLDLLGHVNNAAQWIAVEEALDRAGTIAEPVRAELEHGPGVERNTDLRLRWLEVDGGADVWLVTGGVTATVARVRPLDEAAASP